MKRQGWPQPGTRGHALETGLPPWVEVGYVKLTNCCAESVDPHMHPCHTCAQGPVLRPSLPCATSLLKSLFSSAGVEVNDKTFPSWPFAREESR